MTLNWVLQDAGIMMFTILKDVYWFPGQRLPPHSYSVYLGPPKTGIPMLDLLVLEALRDPTRNDRYTLDAEKCAHIAQSLWLSILPS